VTEHRKKWLRENWYRDIWLFAVTILVLIALMVQAHDRKEAVNANVEARYSDCRGGNETRIALRRQVEQGRLQRPFLLKLLPQFNQPQVLKLIEKNEREELEGFAPRNCIEVAEEALPNHHKRYTLRLP
jgi:hypothetical protein